ncbi:hypothetical protein JFT67_27600 [Pseudomonas simiae]|uniref:hypothetical protein n=1 Tax=Pseudomonas simiae TaxID=321846 RepID=UPI0018E840F4|nr:hypothetical protein [Pseudomonas simiae]MBJ2232797.1 hypothetical protein [Pseudomonas simiae]
MKSSVVFGYSFAVVVGLSAIALHGAEKIGVWPMYSLSLGSILIALWYETRSQKAYRIGSPPCR